MCSDVDKHAALINRPETGLGPASLHEWAQTALPAAQESLSGAGAVFLEDLAGRPGVDLLQVDVITPEVGQMLENLARFAFLHQHAVQDIVLQHQASVAGEVDVDDLDIGIEPGHVVGTR